MAVISLFLGYLFISAACFYLNIVINVITPLVMFTMTTIFAYTHKYVIENRSKEKVKSAMGKYMSQDVMQNVVKNIDNLGLGGKKSVVTVLFADIRGFTSMSEKMSAQQVSEILNEYFSEMEPIITKYNGIINKFIGDAIMAVFGEPILDENHAQNAVKCAYEMLNRVEKLRKKWSKVGKPEIEIGIGINTGEVFIGNIGSVNRMEYTVIGDTVNLASRLESYNKIYQTKMLISASTYKEGRAFADVIKIPDVQIRGKANKIDIYEVLKVKLD
jgi:adenylate cyclase